jgi:hypothetical protein
MHNTQVKFPYGISNFEKVIEQDYLFVDKTHFIELLEKESYSIFLRPRRMGKSLFVSILEYYYDILEKDKFEKLFSRFYIGQHPTKGANSFRVLKFDFSGIDSQTEEDTYKFFLSKIRAYIKDFIERYELLNETTLNLILSSSSPGELMSNFFIALKTWKEKTKDELPIFILIDEYDHFTNEILIRDLSEFKRSVSQDGFVRKFYEAIKIATQQGLVDRFFITGVSPVTMDSFTSGFNIGKHLTGKKEFHDLMGFTQKETEELLKLVLLDENRLIEILKDLKNWYNGYRFNVEFPHSVYNSDMVLYFLDNFKSEQKYPQQMLDPNIMPDYGKIKKLFQAANYQENLEVLKAILEHGEISTKLIYQFSFEQPFDKISFTNLLYYLGNLTLKGLNEYGMPVFVIPNYVIKELFWQYYAYVLQETADLIYDASKVRDAMLSVAAGDIGPFLLLVQKLLEAFSNRDYQRFDEKYIKGIIMAYAFQAEFYVVRSEREIANDGYLDIELLQHPSRPGRPHQYAIELKYLKQSDSDKLQSTMETAKKQLQSYLQNDSELQSLKRLKAVAIVAVKDKIHWEEI